MYVKTINSSNEKLIPFRIKRISRILKINGFRNSTYSSIISMNFKINNFIDFKIITYQIVWEATSN